MPSKRRMQQVHFRNVDEFLDFLPEDESTTTELLRRIVRECLPQATEHLAYNVPYYKVNRNICFIWPASVTWGARQAYTGVRFGFTQGHLLDDPIGYLDRGGRKQVYWRDFTHPKEIDADLLRAYIFQAAELDAMEKATNRPHGKNKSPIGRP